MELLDWNQQFQPTVFVIFMLLKELSHITESKGVSLQLLKIYRFSR